jgi:branched-chain amino acid aminotransferase
MATDEPSLSFAVDPAVRRQQRPLDSELVFGRTFTDHMVKIDYSAERGWYDPRVVPYAALSLDPAASALHYGQALFDGLKAFRGEDGRVRLFRAERHCRRMSEGAGRLCMPAIDPGLMHRALHELVKIDREWVPPSAGTSLYLRPTLIATEPFLGVRPSRQYLFYVIASPVGTYSGPSLSPAKIWVEDQYVRAPKGGLGAVKAAANYAASLLAAEVAKKNDYEQVLWTDAVEHRYLEEVGTMNLMVVIGEELITPPLEGTILGGVTRDAVLTLAREGGALLVSERPIGMEELIAAYRKGDLREVFGCGTAAVITPVGELGWKGERMVINGGEVGPLARRLYDTITGIQYGRLPDPWGWMTEVV